MGDYRGAAQAFETARRLENRRLAIEQLLPDDSRLYPEIVNRLASSLAQAGRTNDALKVCREALGLPRSRPEVSAVARTAGDTLIELLSELELWSDLAKLEPGLIPAATPREGFARLRAITAAAFRAGDSKRGVELMRQLQIERMKVRARRMEAADLAEVESRKLRQTPEETAAAMAAALRKHFEEVEAVENALAEARIAEALAQGDSAKARNELGVITDLRGLHEARLRFATGDRVTAMELAKRTLRVAKVTPLESASIADLLWRGGEREQAVAVLKDLVGNTGASLDPAIPVAGRLSAVAAELKLPAEWSRLIQPAKPLDLIAAGSATWEPFRAAKWQMLNAEKRTRTLDEFSGPVLMLFYLGSGCLHCIEQLNAFAPLSKEFQAAGIEIVAVSTEPADALYKTWEEAREGNSFPFHILGDPELKSFRDYGAFDDFTGEALHGTFLIGRDRTVQWHNIGVEPFGAASWLLQEAKRLTASENGIRTDASPESSSR
jgi:peroxiredoxin